MEQKGFYSKVSSGVLRAVIITIVMLVILSAIMNIKDMGRQFMSVYYLVVTCISIVYGAIYAARKNNRKGWLVGIFVALFYMAVLYLFSALAFKELSLGLKDLVRLALALLVGILSGMLGINL